MAKDKAVLEIEVETIDLEGEGFWPLYRSIIRMKEAFANPMVATVADLDAAEALLLKYIVKPESDDEKRALINKLTAEQFMRLFERISGGAQTAVPPSNGGVSDDTSE